MLNVYLLKEKPPSHLKFVRDVESLDFCLNGTQVERDLLRTIEQATYLDSRRVIDRYGIGLDIMDLSTGCQAALAVVHFPELLISMEEAGDNAVAATLAFCREGNIAIREPAIWLPDVDGGNPKIEARVGNYWFDNLDRLSEYYNDEYPESPELIEGAHHV